MTPPWQEGTKHAVKFNIIFLQSLATIIHQYAYLTPMTKKLLLKFTGIGCNNPLGVMCEGAIFPAAWGVPKSLRGTNIPMTPVGTNAIRCDNGSLIRLVPVSTSLRHSIWLFN